jgi:N-acetylglutamate synthase-like GNAT family acetyltransferase
LAEIILRPAVETDSAAIVELIHMVRINPTGLDWRRFWVAVSAAGEVIGCGQIKPHGAGVFELASIAVHPAFRQQGVARAIIERLLAEGPRPLYLMCRSSLTPFYEKFGFRVLSVAEMPPYFQRMVRLAGLFRRLAHSAEGLAVMKKES